ncbi:MAG: nucleotide exchange factor GrpE [Betaproteobacteria bacterium]
MSHPPDQSGPFSSDANDGPGDAFEHEGAAEAPAQPGDLGELLRKLEIEAAELKDAWMRAKAETENVRRQGQNDVAKAHKFAIERFAQELLNVKDALELTLATPAATIDTLKDGVELTLKNLQAAFAKAQVTDIEPLGAKYDPHRHQAMTMLESDQPPGTVVQVFQKGYLLNDRVLRPALVAVAKASENAAPTPPSA